MLLFQNVVAYGQESNGQWKRNGTMNQKKYEVKDTIRKYKNDSIANAISPPDSAYQKADSFYSELEKRASKYKWTRELHNVIIKKPKKNTREKVKTQRAEAPFVPHEGKHIRNIYIEKLEPFGPTIHDTSRQADDWLQKTANALHVKTITSKIKQSLIVEEGDQVDAYELADNERILRNLSFIQDARIYVKPLDNTVDSVDIIVLTKDLWAKGFDARIDAINEGVVDIWDRNIFGFGHEMQNSLYWDTDRSNILGYQGMYRVKNIRGSFVNGRAFYRDVFENQSYGLELSRPFFSPSTEYAGAVSFMHDADIQRVYYYDTIPVFTPVKYNNYSVWLARSFQIGNKNYSDKRRNLVFSGAIKRDYYFERPGVSENSFHQFHNKTLLLTSISYSTQAFYKSNLIYSFGRTEDIPAGSLYELTFGHEFNEFFDRLYVGLQASMGNYISPLGYLYGKIAWGGFISDEDFEQGLAEVEANYFSHLFIYNRYSFRQFVRLNYLNGINRFKNEYITINDDKGIEGFKSPTLLGTEKVNLNLETVVFTPLYLYGFRFAFFSSLDFGMISRDPDPIWKHRLYSGIGAGVRIRNEHLVFNTFQIKFTFYPVIPDNASLTYLEFSGEPRLRPNNFYVKSPRLFKFNQ
jgi:hypothetical protein